MQQSEEERIKKRNLKVENIHRKSSDRAYSISIPTHEDKEPYPWEMRYEGKLAKVTKEYFRCKGSLHHPSRQLQNGETLFDCKGSDHHSLPLRGGKEFIYPILPDLLNYVQKVTGKKVVITSAHRCLSHNAYADSSTQASASKHMLGAEVDFFVLGMENQPEEIVKLLMSYYQQDPFAKGKKEYLEFKRYDKSDVVLHPWMNQEVFIKINSIGEGRDYDNRHPYPYICIQVRLDRETGQKIVFNWKEVNSNLLRH